MLLMGLDQGVHPFLRPSFFAVYLHDLSLEPSNIKAGYYIGEILLTQLTFVEDICVLCPSVRGLQRILDVCQAGAGLHEIIFNAEKRFVWCLRLRVQKHSHRVADTACTESKICFLLQIFEDCIRYWALRWQRHSEANGISIWSSEQAASFFFPMFERSEKCTDSFLL